MVTNEAIRDVMRELGRRGGSVKSERKAEAARRNGAKNKPKKAKHKVANKSTKR